MGKRQNLIGKVVIAGPEMARNVIEILGNGANMNQACFRAGCTIEAFMERLRISKELRRALAGKMIMGAWDRVEKACRDSDNPAILSTYAKLSADIAAKLAPGDWGEKIQVEQTSLVINTNLDFGVVTGFDAASRDAGKMVEGESEPVDES